MIRLALSCLLLLTVSTFADRPNVIVIMADDMGYESLSVNGSEDYKSPNLDKLAAGGIRFTNGFANPICTPSRVKIMTGMYNVRNYVSFGKLHRSQTTFGHQMKKAGYTTCIAGKWQLGKEKDAAQHFGFDQACLWQHTRSGRSKEGKITYDRRFVNPQLEVNGKEVDYVTGEYGPQICTDFICDFIDTNKEKPFFVYYPMILTHCPFDPTPDSKDWDPKRLGSTSYKGDKKDYQRHFSDMVSFADKMVGQIIAQLEKSGVRDNTLVIFTGDNGTDKPIVTKWNGRKVVGGKGSMTDMGTRVPLIASWPKGIKNKGQVTDELVEFCDVMPTICEAAGAPLPDAYPGDGKSLLPVFSGEGNRQKENIYVWYRGKVIVRNKQFSLIANRDGSDASFIRYKAPYDGEELAAAKLSEPERAIKTKFEGILTSMEKQHRSALPKDAAINIKSANKKKTPKKKK